MNMIYNSEQYSVVEFGVDHECRVQPASSLRAPQRDRRRERQP